MTMVDGKELVNFEVKAKKTKLISPGQGFKITFEEGGNLTIDIDSEEGRVNMEKVLRLVLERAEMNIWSEAALAQIRQALKELAVKKINSK